MAEPKQDSAPACEYLNVHEDAVAQVLAALPDDETLSRLWRFDAHQDPLCAL